MCACNLDVIFTFLGHWSSWNEPAVMQTLCVCVLAIGDRSLRLWEEPVVYDA